MKFRLAAIYQIYKYTVPFDPAILHLGIYPIYPLTHVYVRSSVAVMFVKAKP